MQTGGRKPHQLTVGMQAVKRTHGRPSPPQGLGLAKPSKGGKSFLQCLDQGATQMSSLIFSDDRPGDLQWHINFLRGKKVYKVQKSKQCNSQD